MSLRTPYLARNLRKRRGRKRKPGRRGKGGSGVYPVLLCLGIQWAATSALASEVARQSAECGSYDCAQGNLAARGIDLDIKTVRRLTMALGKKGLQVREARIEQARDGQTSDEFKGKVIVVSADGGRLRVRIPKLRGRRRAETGRRGYECDWREPKCFVIYEVDSKGRKKRKSRPIYDATLGNADGVFEIMLAELKLRGASEAKKLIFLADGADWFWNRIPTLLNELGIEPRRVVRAVDYYHACEHLHEIVELRKGWNKRKRKAWAARMRKLLYAGKVDKVITALEHLCRGPNAKKIRTEMDYFVKRKEMMNYRQLRRRRLPIGSGSVESAVRRIVNLRLKGSGIFWLEKYAERMLYIRAQAKAGRWDEMVHAILSDLPLAA